MLYILCNEKRSCGCRSQKPRPFRKKSTRKALLQHTPFLSLSISSVVVGVSRLLLPPVRHTQKKTHPTVAPSSTHTKLLQAHSNEYEFWDVMRTLGKYFGATSSCVVFPTLLYNKPHSARFSLLGWLNFRAENRIGQAAASFIFGVPFGVCVCVIHPYFSRLRIIFVWFFFTSLGVLLQ